MELADAVRPLLGEFAGEIGPLVLRLEELGRRGARRRRRFPTIEAGSEALQSCLRFHALQLVDQGVSPH